MSLRNSVIIAHWKPFHPGKCVHSLHSSYDVVASEFSSVVSFPPRAYMIFFLKISHRTWILMILRKVMKSPCFYFWDFNKCFQRWDQYVGRGTNPWLYPADGPIFRDEVLKSSKFKVTSLLFKFYAFRNGNITRTRNLQVSAGILLFSF